MEEFEFDFIPDFGPEFDDEIERTAFENTYKVLIGVTTVDKLLDKESLFPYLINYYIVSEEYEKCAKLKKLLK